MRRLLCVILFAALAGSAAAQDYAAPDRELWVEMAKAIANVPMTLPAHQQVQAILQQVQAEAQKRAAAKAKEAEQPK